MAEVTKTIVDSLPNYTSEKFTLTGNGDTATFIIDGAFFHNTISGITADSVKIDAYLTSTSPAITRKTYAVDGSYSETERFKKIVITRTGALDGNILGEIAFYKK